MPTKPAKTAQKRTAKVASTKAPSPAPKRSAAQSPRVYDMPREVSEWIDRANSTIRHLKTEVDRLKVENKELRGWRKWAEGRILRSDTE